MNLATEKSTAAFPVNRYLISPGKGHPSSTSTRAGWGSELPQALQYFSEKLKC